MGAFPMTRESEYTDEIGSAICTRIIQGDSVRTIGSDPDMPATATIMKWLSRHPSFVEQYVRARELRAHARFESVDAIMDELRAGTIDANQARVMIDAIKWQCGKESPKVYGDRLELNASIAMTHSIAESLRMREVAAGLVIDTHSTTTPIALPSPDYPDPDA